MARKKSPRVSAVTRRKARKAGAAASRAQRKERTRIDLRNLHEVVEIEPWRPQPGPMAKRVISIGQNAILRRMEEMWNRLNRRQKEQKLRELLALRELSGAQLVGAFVEMGLHDKTLRGVADERHAADDWLGSYFEGPVVEIFLNGMIVAAQRSIAARAPVAMYWVASAGDMRISVAESAHQVTFLLMTPAPATRTVVRELERPEALWVISGRDNRAVVEQVRPTALVTQ